MNRVKNAPEKWGAKELSEEHKRALWNHIKEIRTDDPEAVLNRALKNQGQEPESLDITYQTAKLVLEDVENPSGVEGQQKSLNPDDDLPF